MINGSTFNTAQRDIHIHNRDSESGLHILRLGVSHGAIHDSAERFPPANCHPDTRKAVRQIILDWINSESSSFFFWLYGPAGAGKTAILQAIAEFFCSSSTSGQNFGGSFFFGRRAKGRDRGHFLFSTIAYQLALKVPGLRQHVNRIMELDPTLHTKSMVVQLRKLIIDAFKHLPPHPKRSYLVIVDGLDECHDNATQQSILQLLCEAVTVHKLPLRFLIGSRPESHIRDSFDHESLYTVTRRVALDEMFNPERDIRVFLQDGFARICAKMRKNNSLPSHVEQSWPGEGIIDLLVQRSSGQFIYAATVLKFVGADFCSPTQQLALILKRDPTAFSDLDHLYTQILSAYPSRVNIVQVLGTILAFDDDLNPEVIEDILGMEDGDLGLVLKGLSSLMEEDSYENGAYLNKGFFAYHDVIPRFTHASFGDYLLNSSRSGPFHVNLREHKNQITLRSFALIIQWIRSWRINPTTSYPRNATWVYFTSCLPDRFYRSPTAVKEAIMTDINDLVQDFWRTSSHGTDGESFLAMRHLFEILQECFHVFERQAKPNDSPVNSGHLDETKIRTKFNMLFDEYRKMFDQSFWLVWAEWFGGTIFVDSIPEI